MKITIARDQQPEMPLGRRQRERAARDAGQHPGQKAEQAPRLRVPPVGRDREQIRQAEQRQQPARRMPRVADGQHHQRHRQDPESGKPGLRDAGQQARQRGQREPAGVKLDEQHGAKLPDREPLAPMGRCGESRRLNPTAIAPTLVAWVRRSVCGSRWRSRRR